MMRLARRGLALAAVVAAAIGPARAQDYPTKPITMIGRSSRR